MSGHFWLTDEQMERLQPFFPKSRGKPRVDDRRVLSGIIYIKKNGYSGRMRLPSTVRPRRFTTGLYAGRAWACSPGSSSSWHSRGRLARRS